MEIKSLHITGYDDMVRSIFITNKKYNDELDTRINKCERIRQKLFDTKHTVSPDLLDDANDREDYEWYRNKIEIAFKIACGSLYEKADGEGRILPEQVQLCHSTIGRFLDISCVVDGLHRGATDDFDAHAKRLESRIVRRSTRTTSPNDIELSDWYKGKVIPFGDLDGKTVSEVKSITESEEVTINLPDIIIYDNRVYRKSRFGYVADEFKDNYDVLRGLTPLGMSNLFTFKCNVTEWAHITRLRRSGTHAAPELQQMIDKINTKLREIEPKLNDDFLRYCLQ